MTTTQRRRSVRARLDDGELGVFTSWQMAVRFSWTLATQAWGQT